MKQLEKLNWKKIISSDKILLLLAAIALLSIVIAYFYFQRHLYLMPCIMCIAQRYLLALSALSCIAAYAVAKKSVTGYWICIALAIASLLDTIYVASRQLWLQSLPEDLVPACGPSFNWMVETSTLATILEKIFRGDGNCADVDWSLFGISIPGWVVVLCVVLLVVLLSHIYSRLKSVAIEK